MLRFLGLVKKVALAPVKCGVKTSLLAATLLAIGSISPQLWELGSHAVASAYSWCAEDEAAKTFDPEIPLSPEKELDLIRNVNDAVDPKLRRVEVLIRKQRAEVRYLEEQCKFIEERAAIAGASGPGGRQVLEALAERLASTDGDVTDSERGEFERLHGPVWLALNGKREALEESLQQIARLHDRVRHLDEKLTERRLRTLRFVPEEVDAASAAAAPRLGSAEFREAEVLLNELHETLFKTVYALDPTLLDAAGS